MDETLNSSPQHVPPKKGGSSSRTTDADLPAAPSSLPEAITDHLPAMIACYDRELRCTFANRHYQLRFGRDGRSVVGQYKKDLIPAEECDAQLGYLKGVLGGEVQRFVRSWVEDDRTIHTDTQYVPNFQEGKITGFYSLIYDITTVKEAEYELRKKSAQMNDLLENITDGYIALDHQLHYTYVNDRLCQIVGLPPEQMIGKHIWSVFPGAVGSDTYHAIEAAHRDRCYRCNEDYFAPLDLWQENRIYPTPSGLSIFVRDISEKKKADEQIRQLSERFAMISKATKDGLFEWDLQTQKVWCSESLYTIFGFDQKNALPEPEEWLARIHPDMRDMVVNVLNGVDANRSRQWQLEVKYLQSNKTWGTLLNRGFVVFNEQHQPVKVLGSIIDITEQKTKERVKALMAETSRLFNTGTSLVDVLSLVLDDILTSTGCSVGEIWLLSSDRQSVRLTAKSVRTEEKRIFFDESADIQSFVKGEGMPGRTWETREALSWRYDYDQPPFIRREAALKAGLHSALSLPLLYNDDLLGVLMLHFGTDEEPTISLPPTFDSLAAHLAAEIRQFQLEQQLREVFEHAPDMICIIGTDRTLIKVNPAMCRMLNYSEEELLRLPLDALLHPDDLEESRDQSATLKEEPQTIVFENRLIAKNGAVFWISWTANSSAEKGDIFCVGKDISEQRKLTDLLRKANTLARIGGWEVNLADNSVYWSDITRQIHEVDAGFAPDMATALGFYRDEDQRQRVLDMIDEAITTGLPRHGELQIVTAKGNPKWVRVILEAEYQNDVCTKVLGSFQDIHSRKEAEIAAMSYLQEKNDILDSIGDSFFAVDKNWITTYWNSSAEETMGRSRENMLGRYFWDLYPDAVELRSYREYTLAMETGQPVHFEDYYPPMDTWFEVSAYPSEKGLSVFFRNITESKRTIRALEESEKRYSDLFHLSPQPMFVYEVETLRFLDVNLAAVTHYGYSKEEFLQMTLRDIRPPEDIALLEKTVSETKHEPTVKLHGMFRHTKKNGEVIHVDIQSNLITYQGRTAKVVLASDVTDRIHYIEAIETQNEKLTNIAWMQSHVIRAPLANIMGLISLLEMLPSDDPDRSVLHSDLLTSAEQLNKVILSITDAAAKVDTSR